MKEKTVVFAVLTAALFLGGTTSVGCGGRLAPAGSEGTGGGSGDPGGTSGSAGDSGAGGSTGGIGGSGGSTGGDGGSGGSTGGDGGSGGSTGGNGGSGGSTGGTGGSTGGIGGSGGSTGGTGGGAGKGGAAGTGGAPGTIQCGTSRCGPRTTPVGNLQPCCPMDIPNACGAISPVGGCLTATPGVADSSCPSLSVMGIPLPGCCRPSGLCGVDLQVIMLGCNDPTLLGGTPASRCRN